MVSELHQFEIHTNPNDIIDITPNVMKCLQICQIKNGIVNIFLPGSTGAISTVEYEPGLVKHDIPELLEKIIPEELEYAHHHTWGDHNGSGHLRSFLLKPSLTVPINKGILLLGIWQQIIFLELDERSRNRFIYCQFIG